MGEDDVVSVVRPEFRPTAELHDALAAFAIEGLRVTRIAPFSVETRSTNKSPVPSRLLLRGTERAVARARARLVALDRAPRSASVDFAIAEVALADERSRGGSLLFDRDAFPEGPGRLFRGAAINFRAEDRLRADRIGFHPAQGGAVEFGRGRISDGALRATLEGLIQRGRASWIAQPSLVLDERVDASLEVTRQLPTILLTRSGNNLTASPRADRAGLKLKLRAETITDDALHLKVDLWLRVPDEIIRNGTSLDTLAFRTRHVTTELVVPDHASVLFGGLVLRARSRNKTGLPVTPPLLDPVLSAHAGKTGARELWFVVRAKIRQLSPDDVCG